MQAATITKGDANIKFWLDRLHTLLYCTSRGFSLIPVLFKPSEESTYRLEKQLNALVKSLRTPSILLEWPMNLENCAISKPRPKICMYKSNYLQYCQRIRRRSNSRLDIKILNCQKERGSVQRMQFLSQRLEIQKFNNALTPTCLSSAHTFLPSSCHQEG